MLPGQVAAQSGGRRVDDLAGRAGVHVPMGCPPFHRVLPPPRPRVLVAVRWGKQASLVAPVRRRGVPPEAAGDVAGRQSAWQGRRPPGQVPSQLRGCDPQRPGHGGQRLHLSYAEMTAASSVRRRRRGGQPSSARVTTSGRTPDSAAIEPSGTPVVRARAQAASTAGGCRVGSCTDRVSSGREGRCGRRVDLTAAHRVPPKGRSVP